jgi:hypothetical protein
MSLQAERLHALLPAILRIRDAEHGAPLEDLVRLFARELAAIEEDIEQLYDDQFIETCSEWVAPYIGDLIGYRSLRGKTPDVAAPRAEVANTIAYRRRKGTAWMLEQLAADLTGRPAHVAEFFEQLATTQYMKHVRLHANATADVRSEAAMRTLGGAFNIVAHSVEVRRPRAGGRYNIPNIGLFLWRLLPLRLSAIPLVPHPGDAGGTRFRLNPLGADMALFRRPSSDAIDTLSRPAQVADPLGVRAMAAQPDDDYGFGKSVWIERPGANPDAWEPVPVDKITVADLRDVGGDWNHQEAIPADHIGLDPERGRIVLGAGVASTLRATFHHGFAREIGGGEYARDVAGQDLAVQEEAVGSESLTPKVAAIAGGGRLLIEDSLTYDAPATITVNTAAHVVIAGDPDAASDHGARPLLTTAGDITLAIGAKGTLELDGLVIAGGTLKLAATGDDEIRTLILRHCTLVPGLSLQPDGSPTSPGTPSLVIEHPFAQIVLAHCITGPLNIADGAKVTIEDCIIDAGAPTSPAYMGLAANKPGPALKIENSTVIGKVHAQRIDRASDTIFFAGRATGDPPTSAPVRAQRTQRGCVRFCWLPVDSIAPRRHRCLPSDAFPTAWPHFAATRYGRPSYMQLRASTHPALLRGASDEGEIGVMHALSQPQREDNLRTRLDEYLRHGLDAGLFHVT